MNMVHNAVNLIGLWSKILFESAHMQSDAMCRGIDVIRKFKQLRDRISWTDGLNISVFSFNQNTTRMEVIFVFLIQESGVELP